MLEGLDDVAWAELVHAYGRADNIPVLLRRLAAAEPEALDDFRTGDDGLVHQGCVYPATAAAVPFLVELATHAEVLGRSDILIGAVRAAICEGTELERPHGVRRALAGQMGRLLGLLDDPNAQVRRVAATGLGHGDPPDVAAGAVMSDRLRVEPDPGTRAALIASAVVCDPTRGREWVRAAYEDPAASVRAAAVYATAVNALPWTVDTMAALVGCWDDGDPLPESYEWLWDSHWWLVTVFDRLGWEAHRTVLNALMASSASHARRAAVVAMAELFRRSRSASAILPDRLQILAADADSDVSAEARLVLRMTVTMTKTDGGWLQGIRPETL